MAPVSGVYAGCRRGTSSAYVVVIMNTPILIDVTREPHPDMTGAVAVHPVWSGVDRPDTGGWTVSTTKMALRLVAAIRAGFVCTNPRVMTDVHGKTYVTHDGHSRILGRRMNADLKRLGF